MDGNYGIMERWMENCKDGENGWIDGWRRLKKYKDGHMEDGNMDGEVQR